MTLQVTWKIDQVDAIPQLGTRTNIVRIVHWRANGVDDTFTSTTYGAVQLPEPTDQFIEFQNLTETQIIEWVKTALGEEQVAGIETDLGRMIENQKNPPIITPMLPWQT
jgi:hypothetical protein